MLLLLHVLLEKILQYHKTEVALIVSCASDEQSSFTVYLEYCILKYINAML